MLFVIKENLISIITKIKCDNQLIELRQEVHEQTDCVPLHKKLKFFAKIPK